MDGWMDGWMVGWMVGGWEEDRDVLANGKFGTIPERAVQSSPAGPAYLISKIYLPDPGGRPTQGFVCRSVCLSVCRSVPLFLPSHSDQLSWVWQKQVSRSCSPENSVFCQLF